MTNEVAKKKQLPAFLVLTIICLIAALALAATNAITKGPIQEHAMAAQREAFGAVMAADEYAEMTIPEGSGISALVEAKKDGQTIGYCVVASTGGYAGPVAVTLGVDVDGKVTGAKIGDTSFAETSGFGSRWLAENQTEQFVGIDLKEGGAIEALSGATVTSNAVLNASNTALSAVSGVLGIERTEPVLVFGVAEKKPVEQMALVGDIHEGSAKGFASDVKVQLTMDDAGVITGLAIESSGETPSFGTRCMEEPAFAEQFVGKTAPFAIGENIDALAGATVTSKAVVEAVNAAVEAPANPDAVPFGAGAEEPAVEAAASLTGDVKTGSAKGFQSDVKVQLTVDENGAIAELIVDSAAETAGFGTRCAEDEAFLAQFIGKTAPVEVDVLAGATVTSKAVIEAVNAALTAPAAETLTATAPGFIGEPVGVSITLNEDGTIATLTIDNSKQMPPVCDLVNSDAFLNQFIGKKGPFTGADIVAGATFTSEGVINALNSLFAAEEAASSNELTATAPGFIGEPVGVSITLSEDGTIATLTIDNSKQMPPVCDLVNSDAFLNQFIGKKGPFTGADIVAGATFTSEGVINALNSLFAAEEAPVATGELTAKGTGFIGEPVGVTITLNEDGTIATMTLDLSDQMAPNCDYCNTEEFLNQFIGKKGPFVKGENVDVAAGATFTSDGIINAVNSMMPTQDMSVTGEDAVAAFDPAAELTAKGTGFIGEPVGVTITLNEDGTIATMTLDLSDQMAPNCDYCNTEEFLNQFIGKKGPFVKGENVDVAAGATFTSDGIINAVNSMMPTQDMSIAGEEAPAATGELTAKGTGFIGEPVGVTITLNEDGTIATMTLDLSDQMAPNCDYCNTEEFLNQFIGKKGPFVKGENVDVAAGATFTSDGIINAVNSMMPTQDMSVTGEDAVAAFDPAAELTAKGTGFIGEPVGVTITLNEDGTIATMTLDLSDQMAPNCDYCNTEEFLNQFIGKKGPFVKGKKVDVAAGATFTSDGIINAVNSLFPAEEAPAAEAPAATGELTAKSTGFIGEPVGVTITLNEDGTIATMTLDLSDQMAPNCDYCNTEEFLNQFIGKKGPFVKGENVDVAAGATFTSDGIINAVNSLFPAEEAPAAEAPAATGELTAKGTGFIGEPVGVTITLNEDGTIATMTLDLSDQMAPNCDYCNTEEFLNQFIGKKGPFVKGENVDVAAGATFTSDGIINAVNSLFPAEKAPAAEAPAATGELTAKGTGFIGEPVGVTITLNEDGTIATMTLDLSDQMAPNCDYCNTEEFLNQFIGKKGPFVKGENVDVAAGATFTSDGIINAVNSLLSAE